jgi:hypothetical protein
VATSQEHLYKTKFISYLQDGFSKQFSSGWYRRNVRQSHNCLVHVDQSTPLERWEKEIIVNETKLINENGKDSTFVHFAHAWGQEYGFHIKIAQLASVHNTPLHSCFALGLEGSKAKKGNETTKDIDASRESLEMSYEAFLAESKDSSSMPLFEHP